jgi:hypothetical protein
LRRSSVTRSRSALVGICVQRLCWLTAPVLARRLAMPQSSLLPPRSHLHKVVCCLVRSGVGASAGSCAVIAARRSLGMISSPQHASPPSAAPMTKALFCLTTHHLLSRLSPFLRDGLLTSPASSHSPPLHSRDSLTLQLRPTFHNPPFCPPLLVHTLALHLQCGIVQSVSHGQSHSISTPRKVGSSASFQFYLCRGRSHTHADSNHTD